ncbi:MAG: ABC transporter permease [Bryobacteraceae bacterium]
MAIPLSYNLRNLAVRRTTTVMTALGIGLTVAVLMAVMALAEGLRTSFQATGHPLNVLVMRRGATSELTSIINRESYQTLRAKAGIARTASGEPMASLEMVTCLNLVSEENPAGMNINLRGLLPIGLTMRDLKISSGRMFQQGRREIVVGKGIASRYPAAHVGGKMKVGRNQWDVVGVFDAGRSAMNSEMLGDLNLVAAEYRRSEALSSVLIRATDEVAAQAVINDLTNDRALTVTPLLERSYYEGQMSSAAPVRFIGTLVAIVLAVGSSFAAMNTMFAAVARRSAEIGTLRVLGFSRHGILVSFLFESLMLSLLGGLLGIVLALPLNNFSTGIGSIVTFSEIVFQFQVTPRLMMIGVAFSLLMGAIGGFFPARSAARREILSALRG